MRFEPVEQFRDHEFFVFFINILSNVDFRLVRKGKTYVLTTEYGRPKSLFLTKSQTFQLGQTIWANKFRGVVLTM